MSAIRATAGAGARDAAGLFKIADLHGEDNGQVAFGAGWAPPEGTMRWAIGGQSDLTIFPSCWRQYAGDGKILVLIEATPFLGLDITMPQRIGVIINGQFLREVALGRSGIIAFWIPPAHIGQKLAITLRHASPRVPASYALSADTRPLVFALHRLEIWNFPPARRRAAPPALAITPAELFEKFESLGDNCEFGLVQRQAGIEPLGLLRFSATTYATLIDGILHEFAGLGDEAMISLEPRGPVQEYILTETYWNLTYHTAVFAPYMEAGRALKREAQKLNLLKRRLFDDLRAARKIYIIKSNGGLRGDDVAALFILLKRFAPNRLVHVKKADAKNPANTGRLVTPGLAEIYIDRFAPNEAAETFSFESWVAVCQMALGLLQTGALA